MPHTTSSRQKQVIEQAAQLRDKVMQECGWPVEKRRKALGKALRVYEKQLEAEKALIVNGEVMQVPDNQAQLRAAEAWTTLEGVNVGKSQEGNTHAPVTITINAPWFSAEHTISSDAHLVDVTPTPNTLIEQQSE